MDNGTPVIERFKNHMKSEDLLSSLQQAYFDVDSLTEYHPVLSEFVLWARERIVESNVSVGGHSSFVLSNIIQKLAQLYGHNTELSESILSCLKILPNGESLANAIAILRVDTVDPTLFINVENYSATNVYRGLLEMALINSVFLASEVGSEKQQKEFKTISTILRIYGVPPLSDLSYVGHEIVRSHPSKIFRIIHSAVGIKAYRYSPLVRDFGLAITSRNFETCVQAVTTAMAYLVPKDEPMLMMFSKDIKREAFKRLHKIESEKLNTEKLWDFSSYFAMITSARNILEKSDLAVLSNDAPDLMIFLGRTTSLYRSCHPVTSEKGKGVRYTMIEEFEEWLLETSHSESIEMYKIGRSL